MTALLIIGIPVALISVSILIVVGAIAFRGRTHGKFGYRFFRFWHILSVIFGVGFIVFGNWVRTTGFDKASLQYHGLVFTAVGVALLGWLLFRNCYKTNLFYGVTGTLFEVVSFFVCSVGMAFFPFLIWGAVGAVPETVIVMN